MNIRHLVARLLPQSPQTLAQQLHHQQHDLKTLPDRIATLKDKLGRLQADPAKAGEVAGVQQKLQHLEHKLSVLPRRIEGTKQQLDPQRDANPPPSTGYPPNDSFESGNLGFRRALALWLLDS